MKHVGKKLVMDSFNMILHKYKAFKKSLNIYLLLLKKLSVAKTIY